MFSHSIRWRLLLWLAFLLVCLLTGFGVTAYQLYRVNQLRQIDDELERRVVALSGVVRRGPPFGPGQRPPRLEHRFENRFTYPSTNDEPRRPFPPRGRPDLPPGEAREMHFGPREIRVPSEVAVLFDEAQTNAFYYALWDREGEWLKRSTNAPADLTRPVRVGRNAGIHSRMRGTYRETYQFTEPGDGLLVGRNIAADLRAMRRFSLWLFAAGSGVIALGLGGGWWLASSAIRPVEEISATASRISAGNLSERIPVADTDNELGQLAGVLNSTFARLEAAFEQQQQFTADASHELRTPIAVLMAEAQTALARPRDAAEYRETVEYCLATAQHMRRLTESLLALARFDAGQEQIRRDHFDLAILVRECVEFVSTLAEKRGIRMQSDLQPVEYAGDPERLAQVMNNLLTNAIHYNRDAGEVSVSVRQENSAAVITVADTGRGISAEDLPHIFKRFYRADKSRTRAEGRTGLGLAISKAIVDAHGGTINVSSQMGQGTTFVIRLPLATTQS